jgi:predicted rRNA methylase YqxC with S4 and FtsJ domains
VIKNAADREAVLTDIRAFIENETPWNVIADMVSPIQGEKGNTEFLVHLR